MRGRRAVNRSAAPPYPKRATPFLVLLAMLSLSTVVLAQGGGDFALTWWTVDGGGVTFATGGDYGLGSTIGQPEAGVLSGGDFTLYGGFWFGEGAATPVEYHIYLPLTLRNF